MHRKYKFFRAQRFNCPHNPSFHTRSKPVKKHMEYMNEIVYDRPDGRFRIAFILQLVMDQHHDFAESSDSFSVWIQELQ